MIAKYLAAFVALLILTASGCGLKEIKQQTIEAENTGIITGKIKVKSDQKGPVVVLRIEDKGGILTIENQVIATSSGKYMFIAEPGEYLIAAFIDVNQDGKFQRGQEHGNFHTDPLTFRLDAKQTFEVETIVISGDPPLPPEDKTVTIDQQKIIENIGKVASLDDPIFVRANYNMGMWRPLDFLSQVGGGFMFLHEYDPNKIPVIFVHGIAGGPTDLRKAIESIDKERFQAWILYYPSGLRLDMISEYFVKSVTDLQNKLNFTDMIVVAHSMGGLITRSFVRKYIERFPDRKDNLRLVMTINSPLGGMPSAANGVKNSPIVVPSWRDVANNSEFLGDLHTWVWPRDIPYYLIFSYEPGEDNDGIVSLNSQIPLKLQSEATRMFGFNNTHVGTVNEEAFIKLFNEILTNGEKGGSFINYVVKATQ
ncbi:lipase family alpha/beta hydrolase [Kaarinaea lacus]